MSRYTFYSKNKAGCDVCVCAGWDPPLNGYHLTVWDQSDPDGEPIYDNTYSNLWFPQQTEEFEKILVDMGIVVPENFWELVKKKDNGLYFWNGKNWN